MQLLSSQVTYQTENSISDHRLQNFLKNDFKNYFKMKLK